MPSVGDVLGDKLTAYAPNTTGIPYVKNGVDASMEIIKQLYDIARLFEKVDNLETTARSFEKISEVELSYRRMENNPKLIYEDIRQISLCLTTRGMEGNGFNAVSSIEKIKAFIAGGLLLLGEDKSSA